MHFQEKIRVNGNFESLIWNFELKNYFFLLFFRIEASFLLILSQFVMKHAKDSNNDVTILK